MIRQLLRSVRVWAIRRQRERLEQLRVAALPEPLAKRRAERRRARKRFRPIQVPITHVFYVYPDGSVYHDRADNGVLNRVKDPEMVKVVHAAYERMRLDVARRRAGDGKR